jgi:predicted DNA-binding protein with PD1-like motif
MKPLSCHILYLFLFSLALTKGVSQSNTDAPRYVKVPQGYLMVLRQGDDIFAQLESFMITETIPSASFTGMGFAETTFGYFNIKTKTYHPKHFKPGELAAMHGSLAWQNGKPSIHTHGIITTKHFKAFGGHLLAAKVGTGTLEIMIIVHDKHLERKKDEALGANVLCLENCGIP